MKYELIDTGIKTHKSIDILDLDNTILEAREFMNKKGVDFGVKTLLALARHSDDTLMNFIDTYQIGYMIGYLNAKNEIN